MLLGATMDSLRAASITKNLFTLHIRMKQHSKNAQFIAKKLEALGVKVKYVGLESHPQFELANKMRIEEFGYGGMILIDVGTFEKASSLMKLMQNEKIGYLAVSLGYFKTLFSSPGTSTSSEVPKEEQEEMGLSDGLIRFSIGLDNNIELTMERIEKCILKLSN